MTGDKNAFLGVSGHLYDLEGYILQELFSGLTVFEIGSHHGRSAVAMAATAKRVYTIDWYQGDGQIGAPDAAVTRANVQRSGLSDKIVMLTGDWIDYLHYYGQVDGVFYDGAHQPPYAYERDFLDSVKLFPHLLIALHDYKPWDPGMAEAVTAIDNFAAVTGRIRLGPEPGTSVVWFLPNQ